jgi:hypothetical protein
MKAWKTRCKKWGCLLSSGGVSFGILQGLGLINWANLLTTLLATWLAGIVVVLLGGSLTQTPLG